MEMGYHVTWDNVFAAIQLWDAYWDDTCIYAQPLQMLNKT